jgi:quinoprotein glucose dehydrogenase
MRIATLATFVLATSAATAQVSPPQSSDGTFADWPYYGGDPGGGRYSPLTQINRTNVAQLKIAWEYHTGDLSDGSGGRRVSAFETTPIVVHGTMYFSTPFNRVIALDPETGKEKWSFDPNIDFRAPYSEGLINRGVTLWTDPSKLRKRCLRPANLPSNHRRTPVRSGRGVGPALHGFWGRRADRSGSRHP